VSISSRAGARSKQPRTPSAAVAPLPVRGAAGGEATIRAQIDTVNVAKKFLLGHPEACKLISSHRGTESNPKGAGRHHEHGSLDCIVAFLGESNWSRSKVDRIIQASTKLDPFIISKIAPIGTPHPGREQQLGTTPTSATTYARSAWRRARK
jgi:hypothetical protein